MISIAIRHSSTQGWTNYNFSTLIGARDFLRKAREAGERVRTSTYL